MFFVEKKAEIWYDFVKNMNLEVVDFQFRVADFKFGVEHID